MTDILVTIRPAEAKDESQWRQLWGDYCAFYEVAVTEDVTMATWRRILTAASPVKALVAEDASGIMLGFANYVLHPHTWSEKTLCYLEDLFVSPEARGQNIGHALIERLIAMGRDNRWERVYWHTNADNTRARRLYDRFNLADQYVRYTVKL